MKADPYIPALSHDWLTPLYDSLIRWTMPESTFKRQLIRQTRIKSRENKIATLSEVHRVVRAGGEPHLKDTEPSVFVRILNQTKCLLASTGDFR